MLGACGEVLPRVVDDVIRAESANHVDVLGAAYAGHFRTERLGDLHGEGTDTPRGAVDQDLLSGVNVSLVAQSLQRGDGRDRHRSRLLESHTGRFQRDGASLPDGDVLGERPISSAEYLVARLHASPGAWIKGSRPLPRPLYAFCWSWRVYRETRCRRDRLSAKRSRPVAREPGYFVPRRRRAQQPCRRRCV